MSFFACCLPHCACMRTDMINVQIVYMNDNYRTMSVMYLSFETNLKIGGILSGGHSISGTYRVIMSISH